MKPKHNKDCMGCRAVKGTTGCTLGFKTETEVLAYHGRIIKYGKPAEPCTKVRRWRDYKNIKKEGVKV